MTEKRVGKDGKRYPVGRNGSSVPSRTPDPLADRSVSLSERRQRLLDMLAVPMSEAMSTRELSRQTGNSYQYADGVRREWERNLRRPTT